MMAKIRQQIAAAVSTQEGTSLLAHKRSLFWSADHKIRLVASVSRRYEGGAARYWYGFHTKWKTFLEEGEKGIYVLGCADLNRAFALPRDVVLSALAGTNRTLTTDGEIHHWHFYLFVEPTGEAFLLQPLRNERIPVTDYAIAIGD
jgi:hypothetical protein